MYRLSQIYSKFIGLTVAHLGFLEGRDLNFEMGGANVQATPPNINRCTHVLKIHYLLANDYCK